jgi:hypothetical protein
MWQNKMAETLPNTFRIELPVIQNDDKYFCIEAVINENYKAEFIIDTKATPLMKIEAINNLNGNLWGKFPVPAWNSYGQAEIFPLYYFDSFKIQSLAFAKPLFKGISKSNAMHDLLDKGVVGKQIIEQLFWKFALDDGKMILFSRNDTLLLQKETKDFMKIENGLRSDTPVLFFPDVSAQGDFLFDLGYADEIMVDKTIFVRLSKKFTSKKYLSTRPAATWNDENYVFEKMTVEWNGIKIPDCRIVYRPVTNRNIIGVRLAGRFNFVLAYRKYGTEDLYLQPREDFQNFKNTPYCSAFGFGIEKREGGFIIRRIEVDGVAAKAGLHLEGKVVHIDHGSFDLNDAKQLDSYLEDKKSVTVGIETEGKIVDKELIL